MLRPRRHTQIPLRYRDNSPPRLYQSSKQGKRRRIDPEIVDRNDVDQALAVIEPAPECSAEALTLISNDLPYFKANYVQIEQDPLYTLIYPSRASLSFFLAILLLKSSLKKSIHTPKFNFKILLFLFHQNATGYLLHRQKYVYFWVYTSILICTH